MSFFNVNYIPCFKYVFANDKVALTTSLNDKVSLKTSHACSVNSTLILSSNSDDDSYIDIKLLRNNQEVKDCSYTVFVPQYQITTTVHFTDLSPHTNSDVYTISVSKPEFCKKIISTFLNI
jgi:hypothetical protein